MRSAGSGASERERRGLSRVPQRKFLRDHSTHRYAKYVRARNVEFLEKPRRVVGEHLDRVRRVGLVALSGAAIVKRDHAEGAREVFDELRLPCRRTRAEAHDHQERFAFAVKVVVEIHIADLNFWHFDFLILRLIARRFTCYYRSPVFSCNRPSCRLARSLGSRRPCRPPSVSNRSSTSA